ncbi:MAG: NUDIX hydrolase [Chloroflexi bacterium]|nr:NUDIX hydrolase [Chloroflexota bacterium]
MQQNIAHYCPICGTPTEHKDLYGRRRPVCPACGHIVFFTPKVAALVLITQGDSVLLIRRSLDPGKGLWACPAGFVDADEHPQDAARREVREETGLEVDDLRLLEVFGRFEDGGRADMVVAYRATISGGLLAAGDDADEVGWFARDALPELVFTTTKIVVGKWVRGEW